LEQFRGGSVQSQYKQGYNASDHQYQPLENKGRRRKRRKIIMLPNSVWFSLSPLYPRTSKRLSMGEEVGTMQFRVQGEQIKKWWKKKKWVWRKEKR
jgi:hypothetical protein